MTQKQREEKRYFEEAARVMAFDGTDGPALPQNELQRRRWIVDIVEMAEKPDVLGAAKVRRPARFRGLWAVAVCLVACLGGVMGLWWWSREAPELEAPRKLSGAVSRVAMMTGTVRNQDRPLAANQALGAGDSVQTEAGSAALYLVGGVVVYLDAHTRLTLSRPDTAPAEVILERGRIVSAVDRTAGGEVAFSVVTRAGRVEVTGTLFEVESRRDRVDLRVLRGTVRTAVRNGQSAEVKGGSGMALDTREIRLLSSEEMARLEQRSLALAPYRSRPRSAGDPASAPSPSDVASPALSGVQEVAAQNIEPLLEEAPRSKATTEEAVPDLIALAQEKRRVRDWAGAEAAYRAVMERSNNRSEKGIALTALGNIELAHQNNPAEALRHFDEYLGRYSNGPLALEAAYGRIRALRQLGRTAEERAALERFVVTYPHAVQTQLAERRLDELASSIADTSRQ